MERKALQKFQNSDQQDISRFFPMLILQQFLSFPQ